MTSAHLHNLPCRIAVPNGWQFSITDMGNKSDLKLGYTPGIYHGDLITICHVICHVTSTETHVNKSLDLHYHWMFLN